MYSYKLERCSSSTVIASEPASYIIKKTYADLCANDVDNLLPEHTKWVKVDLF